MVEQTSNRPETNVVGLVLAGGLSSRMGTDKSKLRFTHNDISLLHHATQLLHQVGLDTVLISGSEPQHIQDEFKGCGPLGGITSSIITTALARCLYCLWICQIYHRVR